MALSDISPFRMVGNLYFVGTYKASSHLLTTSEGHILIDTGYDYNRENVVEGVTALGFDIKDIKYILHSHGHYDHTDATAKLAELTGAKTFLGREDVKYIKGFTPDVYFEDGTVIRLGETEILCRHTPGHTEGVYSFFFNVEENGETLRCGMFGGAGTRQLCKKWVHKWSVPYGMRKCFLRSIAQLKKEHVDVLVGNHSWQNKTRENAELLKQDPANNPFVDKTGGAWQQMLDKLIPDFWKHMHNDSRETFVTYAHRGASEAAPENTFMAFYQGLWQGANGIETDVRKSDDGVLVLHHDSTPARMCGEEHTTRVDEMSFADIQKLNVTLNGVSDKVPTLEDFLAHFAHRDITFAIELKQKDIEKDVAELLRRYGMAKKTFVTSFQPEYLAAMKAYAPEFRTGWLVKGEITDEVLKTLADIGCEELCPNADYITSAAQVDAWHAAGFNVRAWGVTRENMKKVYDCGADGLTANFPDAMLAYIAEQNAAKTE